MVRIVCSVLKNKLGALSKNYNQFQPTTLHVTLTGGEHQSLITDNDNMCIKGV